MGNVLLLPSRAHLVWGFIGMRSNCLYPGRKEMHRVTAAAAPCALQAEQTSPVLILTQVLRYQGKINSSAVGRCSAF